MSKRPNILLLVHRVPFPPNRGDRIRSYHILKFLAQRANVWLATLADEQVEAGALAELQRHCHHLAIEGLTPIRWLRAAASLLKGRSATEGLFASTRLRQTLDRWTKEVRFDAVVIFCSSMVQYLDLPGLKDVASIVDLVDVDSQKFLDYSREAPWAKRGLYRLEADRLRRIEMALPDRATAITLVSDAEAEIYRGFCPNDQTVPLQNGVDLEFFRPTSTEVKPHHCVFVGAMDYFPNANGVTWFCKEVWPKVLASYPKATFAIVGRNPTPAVQSLAVNPGVQVVGTVPDVRPYVASAAAVVVPLRIARGIQNKVLEAMAMGKQVLASSAALDGLLAEPGRDLVCANSPEEWTRELCRMFSEPPGRSELGSAARQFVESNHAWPATLEPLAQLLENHSAAFRREASLA